MKREFFFCLVIVMLLCLCGCGNSNSEKQNTQNDKSEMGYKSETENNELITLKPESSPQSTDLVDAKQSRYVTWLNYLRYLVQDIEESKRNRMYLEEVYASLTGNSKPENIDEETQEQIKSLLDAIEQYRFIESKREKLKLLYDNTQAKSIIDALSSSFDVDRFDSESMKNMVLSVAKYAIDVADYYVNEPGPSKEYLTDGWELDEDELKQLHQNRKDTFDYLVNMVRKYGIPSELTIDEKLMTTFVETKNDQNNYKKIQYFEENEDKFSHFGIYWLELAKCYFESSQYDKCIMCVKKYEALGIDIFNKDYYYARTLPYAISSAKKLYVESDYVKLAEDYLEKLVKNTDSEEWALRYIVAQSYYDIYNITEESVYIDKAYGILKESLHQLTRKQIEVNSDYINNLKNESVLESASKEEIKLVEAYNDLQKEKRKTELPPIYEPLVLTLNLMKQVISDKNLSDAEQNDLENLLFGNGGILFLSKPLDNMYKSTPDYISVKADFDGDITIGDAYIELPAFCLSEDVVIKASVSDNGIAEYDDWVVDKVDRSSTSFSDFKVKLTSKSMNDHEWNNNSYITFTIINKSAGLESSPLVLNFKVSDVDDYFIKKIYHFTQVN